MLKYLLSAFAVVVALIAPDDAIAAHYDYERLEEDSTLMQIVLH